MNYDDSVHDDLEAYVIGALDPPARASFKAHLGACAACTGGIVSYAGTLAALHATETPMAPPAPELPTRTRTRDQRRGFALGSLAVACAALVATIATPAYEHDRARTHAYAEIARMLASGPREVALAGRFGASGRAIVGEGRRMSGFIVRGLPETPSGFVYRVWVRGAAMRRSPGVLERTRDALEILVTEGDALERGATVRVMLERASLETADRFPRTEMLLGTIG